MQELTKITPYEKSFSKWYVDVVKQGNLINYGLVKGTTVFKPNSFAIWENIQTLFNKRLSKMGVDNVYLPLLIPEKYIQKEKDHVKGFAPELGIIERVGDSKVEPMVIRPTSEVLFADLFQKEISSYRDLPLKYNQWVNVVRYEKKTNPFLRTSEFLWHEGHTAHSDPLEARKLTRKIIKEYASFFESVLAIPTIIGRKTSHEKFPGAITTYTVESMMKDGKALQSGTSHYLGQNFAKAFDIKFINKKNKKEYAYQTSWGFSTRIIGAIIMVHGDNRGIVIPPKVARTQVDILELFADKNKKVSVVAKEIEKKLSRRWRVKRDASNNSYGIKAGNSEINGTPLRLEVGPRDLAEGIVKIVRRDTLTKYNVPIDEISRRVEFLLKTMHTDMLKKAKEHLLKNMVYCSTYEELKTNIKKNKFVVVPFAGGKNEEIKIKQETFATSRCIPLSYPLSHKPVNAKCIITGKPTKRFVIFSLSY